LRSAVQPNKLIAYPRTSK